MTQAYDITDDQIRQIRDRLATHPRWESMPIDQKRGMFTAAYIRARERMAAQAKAPEDPFGEMEPNAYAQTAVEVARKRYRDPNTGSVVLTVAPDAELEDSGDGWYEYAQHMPRGIAKLRLRVNPETGETMVRDPKIGDKWIPARTPVTGPFGEDVPDAEAGRRLDMRIDAGEINELVKDQKMRRRVSERLADRYHIPQQSAEMYIAKGPIGFAEAVKTGWYRAIPGGGVGYDAGRLLKLHLAIKKLQSMAAEDSERDLTGTSEFTLVDEFLHSRAELAIRGHSLGGMVGQGVLELPAFMLEFAATGGMGAAGKRIGQRAALRMFGKGAVAKLIARGTGMAAQGVARTLSAVSWARVGEGALRRMLPKDMEVTEHGQAIINEAGDKPLTALLHSFGDTAIEYFSEVTGAQFGRIGRRLAKATPGVRRVAAKLARVPGMDSVFEQAKKVGWDGLTEEWLEERVGGAIRGAFGLNEDTRGEDLFTRVIEGASPGSGKEALSEALVLAVPGAGFYALRRIAGAGDKQGDADGLQQAEPEQEPQETPPQPAVVSTSEGDVSAEEYEAAQAERRERSKAKAVAEWTQQWEEGQRAKRARHEGEALDRIGEGQRAKQAERDERRKRVAEEGEALGRIGERKRAKQEAVQQREKLAAEIDALHTIGKKQRAEQDTSTDEEYEWEVAPDVAIDTQRAKAELEALPVDKEAAALLDRLVRNEEHLGEIEDEPDVQQAVIERTNEIVAQLYDMGVTPEVIQATLAGRYLAPRAPAAKARGEVAVAPADMALIDEADKKRAELQGDVSPARRKMVEKRLKAITSKLLESGMDIEDIDSVFQGRKKPVLRGVKLVKPKAEAVAPEPVAPKPEPVAPKPAVVAPKTPREAPKTPTGAAEKRIVSQDDYNAALDVLRRRRPMTGLDTDMLKATVTIGAYHFENGARSLSKWSRQMLKDVGESIKQHLDAIWQQVVEMHSAASAFLDADFVPGTMEAPKKTIKAYKLFGTKPGQPGKLFPLFIGAKNEVEQGKWLPGEALSRKGFGKHPGWHSGELPHGPQLLGADGKINPQRVWAEVENTADVDWQPEADSRRGGMIDDQVPEGGYYRFVEHNGIPWIISGGIKVSRMLSQAEVLDILRKGDLQGAALDEALNQFRDDTSYDLLVKHVAASKSARRIVSAESYEKALGRLKSQRALTGLDPELLKAGITVGAYHFESGLRDFAAWSAKMTAEIGDWIKPHLQRIWDEAGGFIERGGKHLPDPPQATAVGDKMYQDAIDHYKRVGGAAVGGHTTHDKKDAMIVGAYHLEHGVRLLPQWSGKMVEDLGEGVRPHLRDAWNDANALAPESEADKQARREALEAEDRSRAQERAEQEAANTARQAAAEKAKEEAAARSAAKAAAVAATRVSFEDAQRLVLEELAKGEFNRDQLAERMTIDPPSVFSAVSMLRITKQVVPARSTVVPPRGGHPGTVIESRELRLPDEFDEPAAARNKDLLRGWAEKLGLEFNVRWGADKLAEFVEQIRQARRARLDAIKAEQSKARAVTPAAAADSGVSAADSGVSAEGGVPAEGAHPGHWTAPSEERFDIAVPQTDGRIGGVYRVIAIEDIISSENPDFAYEELQKRNRRNSAASEAQIDRIAKKLDPQQVGYSPISNTGTPIIDGDRQVISGNGRTMALRRVFRDANERTDAYRQFVTAEAARLGLDITGIENPVLVREVTDQGGMTLETIAELSNRDEMLAKTDAELASSDARVLVDNDLLDLFIPNERGVIRTKDNDRFLAAFTSRVDGGEALRDSKGNYVEAVEKRVQRAMLAALMANSDVARNLIVKMVESAGDFGIQGVVDGLIDQAAAIASLAQKYPAFDAREQITQAIEELIGFKSDATYKKPFDWINSASMFNKPMPPAVQSIFTALVEAKSASAVKMYFKRYIESAKAANEGPGLFGGAHAKDANELLTGIRDVRLGSFLGGFDWGSLPTDVKHGLSLMRRGIVRFAEWAAAMVRKLGTRIKPHLPSLWQKAANLHKVELSTVVKGVVDPKESPIARAEREIEERGVNRFAIPAERAVAEGGVGDRNIFGHGLDQSMDAKAAWENLSSGPDGVMARIGQELDDATDKALDFQRRALDFITKRIGGVWTKAMVKRLRSDKKAPTVEVEGLPVMTEMEALEIYLAARDKDGEKHLMKNGFTFARDREAAPIPMTRPQLRAVRKIISEDAFLKTLSDAMWDWNNSPDVRREIDDVAYKISIRPVTRDEMHPLVVLDFEGKEVKAAEEVLQFLAERKISPHLVQNVRTLHQRTGPGGALQIGNAMSMFLGHTTALGSFIGKAIPISGARMYLENSRVRNAIGKNFGRKYVQYLEDHLESMEGRQRKRSTAWDRVINGLTRSYFNYVFRFNPFPVMKQAAAFQAAKVFFPTKYVKMARWQAARLALKGEKKDPANTQLWAEMREMVPEIWHRYTDIRQAAALFSNEEALLSTLLGRHHFVGLARGDMFGVFVGALACKYEMMEKYNLAADMWQWDAASRDEFRRKVTTYINRSQGTSVVERRSFFARHLSGHPTSRLFFMFTNQTNSIFNMVHQLGWMYKTKQITGRQLLRGMSSVGMMQATVFLIDVLAAAIRRGFRPEEEEGFRKDFYTFAYSVITGQPVNWSDRADQAIAVTRTAASLVYGGDMIFDGLQMAKDKIAGRDVGDIRTVPGQVIKDAVSTIAGIVDAVKYEGDDYYTRGRHEDQLRWLVGLERAIRSGYSVLGETTGVVPKAGKDLYRALHEAFREETYYERTRDERLTNSKV
ncbi:MAG TPA: hypothetical protein VM223_00815, partial [Planctomycetota bacterium]|nr:hypothetical protein [Planctomycetota bacterium]